MNSLTLKEQGFIDPLPLKGLEFNSLPSNQNCVIILTDTTLTGKPTSDILYIGKTKKLAKRIFGGYIAGYGGKTTRKIHSTLFKDGFIDKVAISWMTNDDPKAGQKDLLENFKKEHDEYPAWNNTKKTQPKPQPTAKAAKAKPSRKQSKKP
ncbi:MAG: GIY-YIG nuclease family protein [Candidatus Bathyarchaeota archaeon]|nr:GIY-YIG nuclease family protein [Candidatus Bathyarchaeota archaeon]